MTQLKDPHTVHTGLPGVLWVPAMAGLGLIVLPVIGLIVRAPWSRFGALITSESALAAFKLSL
ncbi:MAG TPA: molybdate ABC transporter permease subunit, partial [Pseudonocardiaceae bacterium]|nr:molybdate ABC transporter permease subunit [Pseudonocardiaceae bacterium]